jgi:hypothetical protein
LKILRDGPAKLGSLSEKADRVTRYLGPARSKFEDLKRWFSQVGKFSGTADYAGSWFLLETSLKIHRGGPAQPGIGQEQLTASPGSWILLEARLKIHRGGRAKLGSLSGTAEVDGSC